MKKIAFTLLLISFSLNAFAESKRNLALEILVVTKAKENHELTINTYVNNFKKNPNFNNAKFTEAMQQTMGWEVLKEPMIKIMEETYTENELKGLLRFMKSDVGKSYIKKSPYVNTQMVNIISKNIKSAMSKHKQ